MTAGIQMQCAAIHENKGGIFSHTHMLFLRSKSRQPATVEQQQAFSLLFFAFLTRILALMIYNQREELPRLFERTIQFFTYFYCTLITLN